MATKKPSSKKSVKKSGNTTKRPAKKIKNNAAEIIEATENKELQTENLLVSENTEQTTIEPTNTIQTLITDTPQADTTAPTADISDTSSLEPQTAAIHKDEVVAENASYNNILAPQEKDNTYAYIIGAFVALITIMLFFI
jgi:hypothetical protein